jgi:hypothetical protein
VKGKLPLHIVVSTVLEIKGASKTLTVTKLSQPFAAVKVATCEPAALNVSVLKVKGKLPLHIVVSTVLVINDVSNRLTVTKLSQPFTAVNVATCEPAALKVSVLKVNGKLPLQIVVSTVLAIKGASKTLTVTKLSQPFAAVNVATCEPTVLKVNVLKVNGKLPLQIVVSTVLVIKGASNTLTVTKLSQPFAAVNVATCEPAALKVSVLKVNGKLPLHIVVSTVLEIKGASNTLTVTKLSQPFAAVNVATWEPTVLKVNVLKVKGKLPLHIVVSTVLEIKGASKTLTVTKLSQPFAAVNVTTCEPTVLKVNVLKVNGKLPLHIVVSTVLVINGASKTLTVTKLSQPFEAIKVATCEPTVLNVNVLKVNGKLPLHIVVSSVLVINGASKTLTVTKLSQPFTAV